MSITLSERDGNNRTLSSFTREEHVEYGAPRADEDGVVELKPLRLMSMSLDEEGIARRLDNLSKFVQAATEAGATDISWG